MSGYRVVERVPPVEDYLRVRIAAGLSGKDAEVAKVGLANSVHGVCVEHESEVVGMGRIVGDGAMFFEIVDIAVLPGHQGRGLGAMVMAALMDYLHTPARPGAFVSLFANRGVSRFYERYGFEARPPDAPGMSLRMR